VRELLGRREECSALDRLVADVLAGSSRVLVLRGDAGVGKSALLAYLYRRVTNEGGRGGGWKVASAAGVESEMDLAYSGLRQLCAPLLDHLGELAVPQRDALATVFGMSAGPAPDPFLVGLAALTLVAQAAEEQPLACIVDDAQWLDQASAQLLAFAGQIEHSYLQRLRLLPADTQLLVLTAAAEPPRRPGAVPPRGWRSGRGDGSARWAPRHRTRADRQPHRPWPALQPQARLLI